jgi:serine/threonine protein kinase
MSAEDFKRQGASFGRMALGRRLITEEQLQECLDLQQQGSMRLADLLVEKGYLTQQDVFNLTRLHQARSRIRGPGAPTLSFGLKANQELAGYFVKREISNRSLGSTFEVNKDQSSAALKMLSKEHSSMQGRQFREAARVLQGKQQSAHSVAQIFGDGVYSGSDYVISEWFKVGDIRVKMDVPMPLEQCYLLVRKIAEGLSFAHSKGVIHGDLRPKKIMCRSDGSLAIRDFFYAPIITTDLSRSGRSEHRYLAPEQLTPASTCGPTVDVYALGLIFYELICGQPAFDEKQSNLVSVICRGKTERLVKRVPGLPKSTAYVINRALATSPERRYPDAREFYEDIDCLVKGQPIRADRLQSVRRVLIWLRSWFRKDDKV